MDTFYFVHLGLFFSGGCPIRENNINKWKGPISEKKTKMRKFAGDDRHKLMIIPNMMPLGNKLAQEHPDVMIQVQCQYGTRQLQDTHVSSYRPIVIRQQIRLRKAAARIHQYRHYGTSQHEDTHKRKCYSCTLKTFCNFKRINVL